MQQSRAPAGSHFHFLSCLLPAQDREIMDLFVEHEQAYVSLAKLEQIYENEASLGPVWRSLEKSQRLALATQAGT
jgi:hypothetical protein